jgi:uncharacterized membrane protein (UPF0127 family)
MRCGALVILTLLALFGAACSSGSASPGGAHPTSVGGMRTTQVHAGSNKVAAEVADTEALRERGLSGREALPRDAGMMFVFDQDATPAFWMKGMRFPLDLVWIDAAKHIAGVTADAQPQPGATDAALTLYHPPSAVRYVLELNAGAAARLGFVAGAQLRFDLPPATAQAPPG